VLIYLVGEVVIGTLVLSGALVKTPEDHVKLGKWSIAGLHERLRCLYWFRKSPQQSCGRE
jgi:hypothetical protein